MIVSKTTFKAHMNITGDDRDTVIESILASAQAIIEGPSVCNRKFENATYTESRDGDGSAVMFLRQYPIATLTSITIDGTAISGIGDTDYVRYNAQNGGLFLRQAWFTDDVQNVVVVYDAGYEATDMPAEVTAAVMELAGLIYKDAPVGGDRLGIDSLNIKEGGGTRYLRKMNPATLDAVKALRRIDL